MKAIVQEAYGPPEQVLTLREVDRPAVGDDQVLVRVRAAAVAGDDWHLMRGVPYVARLATGVRRPRNRIPGREFAGEVEAIGSAVTRVQPGDQVFGWGDGAFAEHVAVAEDAVAPVPAGLSPEESAVVPISAFTALQAVRDKGELRHGQRVLIIGASGGVGTFAVQIAVALGGRVTGVATSANAQLVRSLGAERVVDYTREDPLGDAGAYDLIVDLVGNRRLSALRRALAPRGTLVMVGGSGGRWLKGTQRFLVALALSPFTRRRLRPLIHSDRSEDLATIAGMIADGRIAPVVSARYPLSEVPRAVGHFPAGHARGKVAITVQGGTLAA